VTMLYERWSQIASACPERTALRDVAHGGAWTFGELLALSDQRPSAQDLIAFPRGPSADFVLTVLKAWRNQQVICPLEPAQAAPAIADPLPAGVVHLKITSATTGTPRMVAFTAAQLAADANNIVATMGLKPDSPNLGVVSLAHSYGFSNLVLPLLLHGIPLVLVGTALPEAVRRAAAPEPSVTLAGVPALWSRWHEADAIPAHVRLAISAGAPLPLRLEQSIFAKCGLKVHNFYGSSECGGIAYDASSEPRQDGACVGSPLRNVEVAVNSSGCLEVRGPAVGQSYWPEASDNLHNGVFRTSDLAEISEGKVYLRGRASDQINVAGRKVAPETIEEALGAYPGVRDCVAFGVPSADAERGEMIVACLAADAGVSNDSLKQYLMAKLPAWQVPREWWFVDSLAANERGKLSRAEWRKRYLDSVK
jgi:acyl-CoA synthetase (AMP-forming)/AMP-acid ligase II